MYGSSRQPTALDPNFMIFQFSKLENFMSSNLPWISQTCPTRAVSVDVIVSWSRVRCWKSVWYKCPFLDVALYFSFTSTIRSTGYPFIIIYYINYCFDPEMREFNLFKNVEKRSLGSLRWYFSKRILLVDNDNRSSLMIYLQLH